MSWSCDNAWCVCVGGGGGGGAVCVHNIPHTACSINIRGSLWSESIKFYFC